ncbi:MAG TPA: hypothetical protein VFV34_06190 [Blastocatellia bacterium]|nr:hypothetical protein [Blastocatellia bacterium]
MNIKSYIDLRNDVRVASVSLGYMRVTLFPESELMEAQVGYSVSDSGEPFTGEVEGDWKTSWLVIGYEDLCGGPIFVDLAKPEFPVFTAEHGEGDWSPEMIASSFQGFAQSLEAVKRLSEGREDPVKLELNPVSPAERDRVLCTIAELNKTSTLKFWENWIPS